LFESVAALKVCCRVFGSCLHSHRASQPAAWQELFLAVFSVDVLSS